jgi:hypothetical protein
MREDWLWAFDWCLLAVVMLFTFLVDDARELYSKEDPPVADVRQFITLAVEAFSLLFVIGFGGLFGLSHLISRWGYKTDNVPEPVLKMGWGIAFPNVVAILLVLAVFALRTE